MDASAEILPGTHRIDTPLGDRFASLFLFVGRDRSVLFDTGIAGAIPSHAMPYMRRHDLDPARVEPVVVSHCDVDHFGGIPDAYAAFPNAVVTAHEADADAMEDFAVFERERGRGFLDVFGLDEDPDAMEWMRGVAGTGRIGHRVAGDERVAIGGRDIHILHTPGHSRGHLSIWDPENAFLAISDAILGEAVPSASGEPAFPPTYRHERSYLDSIERVRTLEPAFLATAHYGVIEGDAVTEFLDISRDFALTLKTAVLDAVTRSPGMTLEQLLEALNGAVGRWPAEGTLTALAFPVVGHLEQLADEGRIVVARHADGARLEPVA